MFYCVLFFYTDQPQRLNTYSASLDHLQWCRAKLKGSSCLLFKWAVTAFWFCRAYRTILSDLSWSHLKWRPPSCKMAAPTMHRYVSTWPGTGTAAWLCQVVTHLPPGYVNCFKSELTIENFIKHHKSRISIAILDLSSIKVTLSERQMEEITEYCYNS